MLVFRNARRRALNDHIEKIVRFQLVYSRKQVLPVADTMFQELGSKGA